ncbi:MAG: Maf family nucleotide pyrophosphatase [Candidatus Omnitrophota bacterium]
MKKYIILASKSKRRSQILASCGIGFKVYKANVIEQLRQKTSIPKLVILNARKKAQYAAKFYKNDIILGADTLTYLKGKIIGKPATKKDARQILIDASASKMLVFTGLCLIDNQTGCVAEGCEKTELKIKKIDKKDIDKYLGLLKPYDRAGAFTIEGIGSIIFDDLKGSYFNVLGLPMGKLQELFKKIGLDILDFVK